MKILAWSLDLRQKEIVAKCHLQITLQFENQRSKAELPRQEPYAIGFFEKICFEKKNVLQLNVQNKLRTVIKLSMQNIWAI